MKKTWVLGMLACLLLGWIAVWRVQAEPKGGPEDSASYRDTRLLLQASAEALGAEATVKLTLKKGGEAAPVSGETGLLVMGRVWSERLGMEPATALAEQQGHAVYRQERTADGCKQTLLLTELTENSSYVIVRAECEDFPVGAADRAADMQQRIDTALAGSFREGAWNVIVQGGLVERTESGAQSALDKSLRLLQAEELERYEDRGTISRSYGSDRLAGFVLSGSRKVHVQAALHSNSEDGSWRLTLGTPVITTEY
ncbi:YwmB family TATA-box binding protein [Paenibacillus filicis]|uniref:YwmB family TATA-box binding protein n=1 Tax=Paenibacillus filicis TaxID=669464 RepID=A0ABU9DTV0_9BACL